MRFPFLKRQGKKKSSSNAIKDHRFSTEYAWCRPKMVIIFKQYLLKRYISRGSEKNFHLLHYTHWHEQVIIQMLLRNAVLLVQLFGVTEMNVDYSSNREAINTHTLPVTSAVFFFLNIRSWYWYISSCRWFKQLFKMSRLKIVF